MTPRWLLYALVAIAVSMVGLCVGLVLYTNSVGDNAIRESVEGDRKWCTLLSTLDEAYKSTPVTSERGRVVAEEIGKLRTSFGC